MMLSEFIEGLLEIQKQATRDPFVVVGKDVGGQHNGSGLDVVEVKLAFDKSGAMALIITEEAPSV